MVKYISHKRVGNCGVINHHNKAIEIRNANVVIEINFGQNEFEYKGYNNICESEKKEKNASLKWNQRVLEHEEQLNSVTLQLLSAKRNRCEFRNMAYVVVISLIRSMEI